MLQEGDNVPAFKATDENGKTFSSKELAGKKYVLYFYPQDMTETCTIQACNLRDHYAQLVAQGITILGVSPDDPASHTKFRTKHKLPFPLLADPGHSLINLFGVWGEKQMFGRKYMGLLRTTFLVENGMIKKVILKPKSKQHAEEILKAWKL